MKQDTTAEPIREAATLIHAKLVTTAQLTRKHRRLAWKVLTSLTKFSLGAISALQDTTVQAQAPSLRPFVLRATIVHRDRLKRLHVQLVFSQISKASLPKRTVRLEPTESTMILKA